jgi:inner membrane protein
MRPAAGAGCLATIAVADFVLRRRGVRWIVGGFWDEPAHVATAGLALVNMRPRPPAWGAAFLVGSVLPDVDHVPLALRTERPTADHPRPVTHSLAAFAAPLAVVARATGSGVVAAVAAGTVAHFARDLAGGPGVPLLYPLSRREFRLPYRVYAVAAALLAARAWLTP